MGATNKKSKKSAGFAKRKRQTKRPLQRTGKHKNLHRNANLAALVSKDKEIEAYSSNAPARASGERSAKRRRAARRWGTYRVLCAPRVPKPTDASKNRISSRYTHLAEARDAPPGSAPGPRWQPSWAPARIPHARLKTPAMPSWGQSPDSSRRRSNKRRP